MLFISEFTSLNNGNIGANPSQSQYKRRIETYISSILGARIRSFYEICNLNPVATKATAYSTGGIVVLWLCDYSQSLRWMMSSKNQNFGLFRARKKRTVFFIFLPLFFLLLSLFFLIVFKFPIKSLGRIVL